jgi:hypothetical protein
MDNYVLISLKKIFNNDDIIDKIYNYYILDKYFSKRLTYTSTKIFKELYHLYNMLALDC